MKLSQIFAQAHRITRITLQSKKGSYRATLSAALKAIYAGIKAKKASILKVCTFQKNRSPQIFKKTIEVMMAPELNSPHLVGTVAAAIISSIPSIQKASQLREEKAYNYYKKTGGAVTMC